MAAVADKATAVSGINVGDAARRRNVAAPQPPVVQPAEADDKKKLVKKVRIFQLIPSAAQRRLGIL